MAWPELGRPVCPKSSLAFKGAGAVQWTTCLLMRLHFLLTDAAHIQLAAPAQPNTPLLSRLISEGLQLAQGQGTSMLSV